MDQLAEDHDELLQKVKSKATAMDPRKLDHAVREYGTAKTKKVLDNTLDHG